MAKSSYKIPTSIDKSFMDMEINLQTKDGMGGKPIKMGLVFGYLASVMTLFMVMTKTFMDGANLFVKIIFGLTWLILTSILLKRDDTNLPQYSLVPTMFEYLPKKYRYITTRSTSHPLDFYRIVGIENIDLDRGLIKFVDGTYGYMYQVVGSASVLLFESDRDIILDRVDKYWRKVKVETESIFITVKEPQKVYKQVAALKDRYDNLDNDEPDLKGLAEAQFRVLTEVIGTDYRIIHQYLILKSHNKESLLVAKNVLQGEVENSTHMFKQCTALFGDELLSVLSSIYKGKESV